MPRKSLETRAIAAIERQGVLLVYPLPNRKEVPALWSVLYPRSEMHWSWDADADPRVSELWRLREQIARGRQVVYSKWFRGRAVFFSQALFGAMLAELRPHELDRSREADELLELLDEDSPQSSKLLRGQAGLRGQGSERAWTRALKELWERLLIVGTGEVDDGAFPSLELGATRWIFEPLWEAAGNGPSADQRALIDAHLPPGSAFGKHWRRLKPSFTRRA